MHFSFQQIDMILWDTTKILTILCIQFLDWLLMTLCSDNRVCDVFMNKFCISKLN